MELLGYREAAAGTHPESLSPAYGSTVKRAPSQPLIRLPTTLSEVTGPTFTHEVVGEAECDLTKYGKSDPIGERIIVTGRVLDEDDRPVARTLVELWQCNSTGRYNHERDQHDAPLDPNFWGSGRAVTDDQGWYRFTTIKPGAYPWRNHQNAWRPAHIHFSLFGPSFSTRLITQMYFPGDPLIPFDPMVAVIADQAARDRMVCAFDLGITIPEFALGYRYDIVLRGRNATPMEA